MSRWGAPHAARLVEKEDTDALAIGVAVTIFPQDDRPRLPLCVAGRARNGQLDERSEASKQAEELFGDEEVSS